MATATCRPTTADLLYAHDHALEQIERLRQTVAKLPLLEAEDVRTIRELFVELDDLADEVDGLETNFQRNTRG
ncbi:hypothetical protein [Crateriforma spongiae]|uniref:hypothetical protein n=1 Tax=Crateriforma spongiae TaxID=2724528 RepID=UPI0039B0871B